MRHFNETQGDLMGLFLIEFLFFVQFTEQMSKLNGLGKTYRKCICTRTINFSRPFTTRKLLERIQIFNE